MSGGEVFLELRDAMRRELVLFGSYVKSLEIYRESIQNRHWSSMQRLLQEMGPLSDQILKLDQERTHLQELLLPAQGDLGFYRASFSLPAASRRELQGIFFQLRSAWIRARTINLSVAKMMETRMTLLRQTLSILSTHQDRQGFYDQKGKQSLKESRPLLVSQDS